VREGKVNPLLPRGREALGRLKVEKMKIGGSSRCESAGLRKIQGRNEGGIRSRKGIIGENPVSKSA